MQVSKKDLNKDIKKQIFSIFYQLIADLKTSEEVKIFLRDFLTKSERTALVKRLAAAIYLEKNRSYDEIKKKLKISSATIANVQRAVEGQSRGFALALQRIEADQWASDWSKKISRFLGKIKL